jgi:hypothetical protein
VVVLRIVATGFVGRIKKTVHPIDAKEKKETGIEGPHF